MLHENPLNQDGTPSGIVGGAVTNVIFESALFGQLPLNGNQLIGVDQERSIALIASSASGGRA